MWCKLFVPNSIWESNFTFSLKSGFCLISLNEAKSSLQFFFRIPRPSPCLVVGMMVQFGPSVHPSVLVDYIFCPHECVAAWPFVRLKDGITLCILPCPSVCWSVDRTEIADFIFSHFSPLYDNGSFWISSQFSLTQSSVFIDSLRSSIFCCVLCDSLSHLPVDWSVRRSICY